MASISYSRDVRTRRSRPNGRRAGRRHPRPSRDGQRRRRHWQGADLIIDEQQEKVRFLLVEHGGFLGVGDEETLVPVDAVTDITKDEVIIDQAGAGVAGAPEYDATFVNDRPYHAHVYSYFGNEPYWGATHTYPLHVSWALGKENP
ncbi:PRC-barrel domain-containing protein [Nakamurella antarctica]|uniref:PRC-barrel domain-containing protein n=1 Tax=Nakamurella antarctica TaxID=1902245 RepID=UPI0019D01ADD|nr:PRC-barrel domain-containing protein [Nakamurella antarctica]